MTTSSELGDERKHDIEDENLTVQVNSEDLPLLVDSRGLKSLAGWFPYPLPLAPTAPAGTWAVDAIAPRIPWRKETAQDAAITVVRLTALRARDAARIAHGAARGRRETMLQVRHGYPLFGGRSVVEATETELPGADAMREMTAARLGVAVLRDGHDAERLRAAARGTAGDRGRADVPAFITALVFWWFGATGRKPERRRGARGREDAKRPRRKATFVDFVAAAFSDVTGWPGETIVREVAEVVRAIEKAGSAPWK